LWLHERNIQSINQVYYKKKCLKRSDIMGSFKTRLRLFGLPVLFLSILLIAGCGSDDKGTNSNNPPPNPEPNTVVISNFSYSPSTIIVGAGETITWRNDDAVGHTVTSISGSELNSPVLAQGQTYQHTFSAAGSYPYHCTLHPNMTASVTVQP
jgi:plastocyanin